MPYLLADASAFTHQFLEGPYSRAPKELGCAFTASLMVSPLVSIIDKAMVQSGVQLLPAMATSTRKMFTRPKAFFSGLSFRLTFIVYFGTFAVANLSEAALDYCGVKQEGTRKKYKVSGASAANIGLLAWRDSVLARLFSAANVKRAMLPKTPIRTINLFAIRDCTTMAATFYFAPKACEYLVLEHDCNRHVAEISTALTIPVISQFITAPLHIHAMDFFNRPVASWAERIARIKAEMGMICFARGLRILPAFGIGSYSNNKLREMTIRQPNEELLFTRRIARRLSRNAGRINTRYETFKQDKTRRRRRVEWIDLSTAS